MIDYKLNITGCDDLMEKFMDLSFATKGRALKEAVGAACTPVVKVAKKKARKRSGVLSKSIGKKVILKRGEETAIGIVGPRRGFSSVEFFGGKDNPRVNIPTRYAHLIEKGHIAADGSFVPGTPFIGPAADETQGEQVAILRDRLAGAITKAAQRKGRGR